MKKILLTALCATIAGGAAAQNASTKEPLKTTVFTPHFTEASKKIVVPTDSYVLPEIHDGLIALEADGKALFVNAATQQYVFGTDAQMRRFNSVTPPYFSGGVCLLRRTTGDARDSETVMVYPNGKYRVLPAQFTGIAAQFSDGVAIAQKRVNYANTNVWIDKNGREIFPALADKPKGFGGDGKIYPVRDNRRVIYNSQLEKYGYSDAKGVIVIKPQFDRAMNFSEGMAAVMFKEGYNEKWGFIDLSGKLVVAATYRLQPGRFSEGLAPVKIGTDRSDFVMNYIDKTGKRAMPESLPYALNEFHDSLAWVATGCDKLYVMNRQFREVRNLTKDFYHNGNGFGVCSFDMKVGDEWGIDFPDGMRALNQGGAEDGDIFASDGTILYACKDSRGNMVRLSNRTEGELFFCHTHLKNDGGRLKGGDLVLTYCFVNSLGEIVYYFVEGYEGFEGPTPVKL